MKESSRIIINTVILYIQLILSVLISLFSTRWILEALGVEDFGIYNLIAGVVAMLSFLNTAMAGATQRYLSFSLGEGNISKTKEIFYYSVIMHLLIGFVVVLLLEIFGSFLIYNVLLIPKSKILLSIFILHCISISTLLTIINVPYQAALNAHENILLIALVTILESIFKLAIAYTILYYHGERLKLYAFLMIFVPLSSMILMRIYCKKNYNETHIIFHKIRDMHFFREIIIYAWWNLLGTIANLSRNQGVSFIMNLYKGVAINASYGIANQVNGQISFVSSSIIRATRPAIIREIGAGNKQKALDLSVSCCRFTFMLMTLCAIPLILEMPFILKLWLNKVPEYSIEFCQLFIIVAMINQMTSGLFIALEGNGNIKTIQICISFLHIMVIPLGLISLNFGLPPTSVIALIIFEEIIAMVIRIAISVKLINFKYSHFLFRTIFPQVIITSAVFLICYYLSKQIPVGNINLIATTMLSSILFISLYYSFVLQQYEREIVKCHIITFKSKLYLLINIKRR